MATKKQQPTAKKRAAKKSRAKARAYQKAVPPPDNPLLRHEELDIDRRIEGETIIVEGASLTAARAFATGRRARVRVTRPKESTMEKLAKLRLYALQESRGLPGEDAGAPTLARARSLSSTAPGEVEMVAPVAGTSNWVQLGPTAIPKGQTYRPDARYGHRPRHLDPR